LSHKSGDECNSTKVDAFKRAGTSIGREEEGRYDHRRIVPFVLSCFHVLTAAILHMQEEDDMSDQNEDRALSENERKLAELEKEEDTIENEDHHGFADAARGIRLRSEIEALDTDILHEKERDQGGR
jgi:hypothetical protein